MKTTNTKNGNSKHEKRYAISEKAYNDFVERIRNSLEDIYYDAYEDALRLLDAAVEYDNDDLIDIIDCEIEAQVAFLMIKPEIEKAIKRSQTARQRAGRRRKTAKSETVAIGHDTIQPERDTAVSDIEQPSTDVKTKPATTSHHPHREGGKIKYKQYSQPYLKEPQSALRE
jgi:hypothetical protein